MYTTDSATDAIDFGKHLTASLRDDDVQQLLTSVHNGETPDIDIFKGGYAIGATHAYREIVPKAMKMGRTLKSVYDKLEEMMRKHDDVAFMADLAALRGEIGAFMTREADEVLRATRAKLSMASGVPEEYIDDKVLISDIPSKVLTSIGRRAADDNMRMFAIYAVSGCISTKDGDILSMEELTDLVRKDKIAPNREVNKANYFQLLPGYGAVQVRNVRSTYRQVLVNLEKYKQAHSTDAQRVTEGLVERLRHGGAL